MSAEKSQETSTSPDNTTDPKKSPVPIETILKNRVLQFSFRRAAVWFTKNEILLTNVLAVLVGIISGYAAIGFRLLIGFFQNLFMKGQVSFDLIDPMAHLDHFHRYWMVLLPIAGMYVVWLLVRYFAREAKGHGIPEVMEAVIAKKGIIRKRVVGIKALASSICMAAGGSVGREGPIVQIGSATGSSLGQIFKLKPSLIKVLIGCGAAGGVAATFNTPIAGVIFAIEVILLELKTSSFIPLVISTVFATVVSRIYLGAEPAFIVPAYTLEHSYELIFYLGLGAVAAVVGVMTIHVLYLFEDTFDQVNIPNFAKPLMGGLILGLIGLKFPQVFGVGYETISDVLQQNTTLMLILPLIFVKIIAMSVTLGAGGSGGIFAPSLFIGAMLGGAYGIVMNNLFPNITGGYGGYALVGMAAVFSSTSRATLSAITILFEMTQDYHIILPLMFACVVSDQLSWVLSKDTIYTKRLRRRGLNYSHNIGIDVMDIKPIEEVMTTKIVTASDDMTIQDAVERLIPTEHHFFPVVNSDKITIGIVSDTDIEAARDNSKLQDKIQSIRQIPPILAFPQDSITTGLKKMKRFKLTHLMIVDRPTRKLMGIVSAQDFIKAKYTEDE